MRASSGTRRGRVLEKGDVPPVEQDARGILDPAAARTRFRLDRFRPSPRVARFVDRYWSVSWDLPAGDAHTQRVLAHPVVNVSLFGGEAVVRGVTTRIEARVLTGSGRVLGVMFRPAGFWPLLRRPMTAITDAALPAEAVFGPSPLQALAGALRAGPVDAGQAAAEIDDWLAGVLPATEQPSELTAGIVERVAADPAMARVEALAAEAGLSVRQLQRRFAEHVGLNPKAVIRRYRLYEAAERARLDADVDWAALAAELRYSDQSHLVRDFTATFGISPERYARRVRS